MDLAARTSLATAVVARDTSDLARTIVNLAADDTRPGEMLAAAARLRRYALAVMDRAALAERAAGATWDEVAQGVGMSTAEAKTRYAAVYDRWALAEEHPGVAGAANRDELGLAGDPDPVGTAETLDSWRTRHAEPWDADVDRMLADVVG